MDGESGDKLVCFVVEVGSFCGVVGECSAEEAWEFFLFRGV